MGMGAGLAPRTSCLLWLRVDQLAGCCQIELEVALLLEEEALRELGHTPVEVRYSGLSKDLFAEAGDPLQDVVLQEGFLPSEEIQGIVHLSPAPGLRLLCT